MIHDLQRPMSQRLEQQAGHGNVHLALALVARSALLAVCCVLAGCYADVKPHGVDAAVDVDAEDDTGVDLAAAQDADSIAADAGLDLKAACPGGAGCACDKPSECDSGFCLATAGGSQCAQICTTGCNSAAEKCVSASGSDVVNVCVAFWDWLCDPCSKSSDCNKTAGLGDALCVDHAGLGGFCGVPCQGDNGCPTGYRCGDVTAVDGPKGKQCVPKSASGIGECTCSAAATKAGLSTTCAVAGSLAGNPVQCAGKRVCGAGGLTACDAPSPGTETCDGKDNDCDGLTDEQLCDDGEACTKDACEVTGACKHVALDDGTGCPDGDACTSGEVCSGGKCLVKAANCDDGKACTQDACDIASGCTHSVLDGKGCDADGNACTEGDVCQGEICATGAAKNCDDAQACTDDSCDANTGQCSHVAKADGVTCEDGSACTSNDGCLDGKCKGKPVDCNDGNPCTSDGCDVVQGCVKKPVSGTACDDGNPCTVGDTCKDGGCEAGAPLTCPGADACIAWACDPVLGKCKASYKKAGTACSDDNPCTKGDVCGDGACTGDVIICDDNNPCTEDSCSLATGCTTADANGKPCDADGSACTAGDACQGGKCAAGPAKACDDGNACTDDGCDMANGCTHTDSAAACDDGNACTTKDICTGGECSGGPAVKCDDGNPCTDDACDKLKGCVHLANVAACSDGDACTSGDGCKDGVCSSGQAAKCQDGDPCTDDACDKLKGCVHLPNAAACDDGDACTKDDTCKGGSCDVATSVDCQDGNACTDDVCDKASGCKHLPNAAACSDGNACTAGDACSSGACLPGSATGCDDGNACTTDSCDAKAGCIHGNAKDGTACDDGVNCTTVDLCQTGQCKGTAPWLAPVLLGEKKAAPVVVALPDDSVVVAGSQAGPGKPVPWAARVSKTGQTLWTWTQAAPTGYFVAGVRLGASTVLAGGLTSNDFGDGWLAQFDDDGKLIKQWTVNKANHDGLQAVATLPDGGIVAVGFATVGGYQGWLLRFDSQLNLLWDATFPGSPYAGFNGVTSLPSGDLVAMGNQGTTTGFVVVTSASGVKKFSSAGDASCASYGDVLAASDGGFIATGMTGAVGDYLLSRFNAGGQLTWSKVYPGKLLHRMIADGPRLLVAGSDAGGGGMFMFDEAGSVLGTRTYGGGDLWSVARMSSGFALVGLAVSGTDQQWLLRTDAWGYGDCAQAGACGSKKLADCDDGNPCTLDGCEGKTGCTHSNLADGSLCSSGSNLCLAGMCNAPPAGMAFIPAGSFNMGCVPGDSSCYGDESPQHAVTLDAYYIDLTEETVAKYQACVNAGTCTPPDASGNCSPTNYGTYGVSGKEQHPVNCVNWTQADAYCKWTDAKGHLPTEAQWEKAARGGLDGKKFPWDDADPTCAAGQANTAVWSSGGWGCGKGSTWPVGTGSAKNGYGLYDMAGNVWEWVADWYGSSYYNSAPATNPTGPGSGSTRVGRGGSVGDSGGVLRASRRVFFDPSYDANYYRALGFRCARSYP